MKTLCRAAAAAAISVIAVPAHAATTFDFVWTGDPALDASITASEDSSASAFGTFVFQAGAVAPGNTVLSSNVTSFSLTFGPAASQATLTAAPAAFFLNGTVAADGGSIALADLFVSDGGNSFGCLDTTGTCQATLPWHIKTKVAGQIVRYAYLTDEDARASLRMTARQVEVIPLPATLPLLLGALGLFAVMRRRTA